MKSYRSSLTFIKVDILFHELLPFVQNSFSGLFLAILSHISMTLDKKLPYEELQIKFYFRIGWPTFSWLIALCPKFVFRTNGCRFEFVWVGGGPVLLKQYSQYACYYCFIISTRTETLLSIHKFLPSQAILDSILPTCGWWHLEILVIFLKTEKYCLGGMSVRPIFMVEWFGICILIEPSCMHIKSKGAAVVKWLSSWLTEQGVWGSIPGLTTWISEIGYLLLPSRDITERLFKRRKS